MTRNAALTFQIAPKFESDILQILGIRLHNKL